MIYFQVHRSYVMRDDITNAVREYKDLVGIARFDNPFDARQFILRPHWRDDELSHPCIEWVHTHDDMTKEGWDLDYDNEKEPTEAVDSGLLIGDEVPVVLRIGRGFAGLNDIMAVFPTLPPNPWLYDHAPNTSKLPKMFMLRADGGKFVEIGDLRATEVTSVDHSYHPILPAVEALVSTLGKKVLLCKKITTAHTEERIRVYTHSGDISTGNSVSPGLSTAYVDSYRRIIDLG